MGIRLGTLVATFASKPELWMFMARARPRVLAFALPLMWASPCLPAGATPQHELVTLFRDLCTVPQGAAALLEAGEQAALANNWLLRRGGRTPFVFLDHPPDSNGKPFFDGRFWEFTSAAGEQIGFTVQVAGPEFPGIVYNMCAMLVPGNRVQELTTEIRDIFGVALMQPKAEPPDSASHAWLFSQDGTTPENCQKAVTVGSYHPHSVTVLGFVELDFPKEAGPISNFGYCLDARGFPTRRAR